MKILLRGHSLGIPARLTMLAVVTALPQAGVMEDGLVSPVDEGTPQGGPLSPLLSNLCSTISTRN